MLAVIIVIFPSSFPNNVNHYQSFLQTHNWPLSTFPPFYCESQVLNVRSLKHQTVHTTPFSLFCPSLDTNIPPFLISFQSSLFYFMSVRYMSKISLVIITPRQLASKRKKKLNLTFSVEANQCLSRCMLQDICG